LCFADPILELSLVVSLVEMPLRLGKRHAAFMDALAADGFIVLGGPVGDGDDFLFAIKAADESEIRLTLQRDPWSASAMLEIKSIQPWTVLLESATR
jgi:uncharacterized protein YciI